MSGTAAAAVSHPGFVRGGNARGTGGGRRSRRRAGEQYSAMPLYTDMDRTGRHSVAELRGRPVAGPAPSFRFLAHPSRLLSPVGRLCPQRIGRRRVFEQRQIVKHVLVVPFGRVVDHAVRRHAARHDTLHLRRAVRP